MTRSLRILALLLAFAAAAALWLWNAYQAQVAALHGPLGLSTALEYEVPSGASFTRVAEDLEARGWVPSARFLAWYADRQGQASAIKAGTYLLEPGMSALDAVALFVSGREVQYPFTIVEGWTFNQLRTALAAADRLEQTLDALDAAEIMRLLGRPERHPEGMFLADTYLFAPGTTDLQALERAHAALERTLRRTWEGRASDLPFDRPYQALILASIIEKETALAEERPRIAGVFVSRLRRNMLLQTDPTVIYGLGDRFDGDLRRRDLESDTPYNTYTRRGLPPTPIALVGPQALSAALQPDVDGSLFFVSRGDGSHHFSSSYDEHQRAVRCYQLRGSCAGLSGRE
jgi:UPF0755 protein